MLQQKDLMTDIQFEKGRKVVKLGNGSVLHATKEVTLPVKVFDEDKELKIKLIPGYTPLLLARSTLADWGIVQDFRNSKVQLLDRLPEGWKDVEQSIKGHFLFDLLGSFKHVDETAMCAEDAEDDDQDHVYLLTKNTDQPDETKGEWKRTPDDILDEILLSTQRRPAARPIVIWEVFVDRGIFSKACQEW